MLGGKCSQVKTAHGIHTAVEAAITAKKSCQQIGKTVKGIFHHLFVEIKGGYTIYQEDISELLDILEELNVLREELKDSNAVSMQNYQTVKRIRALAEKNRLHDELHRQTSRQINLLNDWLTKLVKTDDANEKSELLRRIVVVGAYLKRRNNLILVSEQDGMIKE